MRLKRLMTSSTASSSGSAPPDSEVPEPRGTTRMSRSLQYLSMRETCATVSRQHHHQRQLAIGGEPVALEGAHAVDLIDDALARHDDAHVGDDLVARRASVAASGFGMAMPDISASLASNLRASKW